jgi:hypothetical protein
MLIYVTTLKKTGRGRNFGLRHTFADVDVKAAYQLISRRGDVVKSHLAETFAPSRPHRPISNELPRILRDEGIKSRSHILQAA